MASGSIFIADGLALEDLLLYDHGLTREVLEPLVQLGRPMTNLTRFIVKFTDRISAVLPPILTLCPALEELEIIRGSRHEERCGDCAAAIAAHTSLSAPLLRSLVAPVSFASVLVPGRPIGQLRIEADTYAVAEISTILETLAAVAQTTAALHDLQLPAFSIEPNDAPRFFTDIAQHFPELRVLGLNIKERKADYQPSELRKKKTGELAVGLPSETQPGYRYDTYGGMWPPPVTQFASDGKPEAEIPAMKHLMHLLVAADIPLPGNIHSLRVNSRIPDPIDEHGMILELERRLPQLRRIEYCWWAEEGDEKDDVFASWVKQGGGIWVGIDTEWSDESAGEMIVSAI